MTDLSLLYFVVLNAVILIGFLFDMSAVRMGVNGGNGIPFVTGLLVAVMGTLIFTPCYFFVELISSDGNMRLLFSVWSAILLGLKSLMVLVAWWLIGGFTIDWYASFTAKNRW